MRSNTSFATKVTATISGVIIAGTVVYGSMATYGGYSPPTGNGGSPTPIWDDPTIQIVETEEVIYTDTETAVALTAMASPIVETPTASPIAPTAFPTVILPSTGSGSTFGN